MSGDTFELYVKPTSNYEPGRDLETFTRLGPEWTGESVTLPFPAYGRRCEVVGWTDLFTGRACPAHVAHVRDQAGRVGWLVWGGNSGVRVLNPTAENPPWAAHLPAGHGWPFVWVDDPGDLPAEVRAVVDPQPNDSTQRKE